MSINYSLIFSNLRLQRQNSTPRNRTECCFICCDATVCFIAEVCAQAPRAGRMFNIVVTVVARGQGVGRGQSFGEGCNSCVLAALRASAAVRSSP